MAKFNGFGGGPQNMQMLMKQAQKMQEEALRAQKEIEETEITGESSNGLVSVTIDGNKNPISISIKPEIVDPDDVEMLEDLVLVALKDASEKADKLKEQKLGKFGSLM